MRDRFEGQSWEKKKHGARELRITSSEIQVILDAFRDEVQLCHRLLMQNGLIPKLRESRDALKFAKQTQP